MSTPAFVSAAPYSDVRADAAAVDDQFVDQERERDLVHLLLEELVLEPARERHQDVGRDRAGDGDAHAGCSSGGVVARRSSNP